MDLRPGRFRQRTERAKFDVHAGWRTTWLPATVVGLVVALATATPFGGAVAESDRDGAARFATTTPIKHLVVIYQENVSFDHYFATYPNALNPAGEPAFHAAKGTPSVNGLNDGLLTNNPNLSNPQRLARSQALTCDQGHDYTEEQSSFNHGLMDKFVEFAGANVTVQKCGGAATGTTPNYAVMDYYDGNTVTALWNYAQRYSMSDNHFSTGFGPSTPGALNLVSGNTFGATCADAETFNNSTPCPKPFLAATPGTPAPVGTGTIYGDPQPAYDKCSTRDRAGMGGSNVGDLLGQAQSGPITWGWFEGGFADCTAKHTATSTSTMIAKPKGDYIPHHQPFQYYASTANPTHLPPTSAAAVGHQDQANHQYDMTDFWTGVAPAATGDLTLREEELRRSPDDGPGVDPEVHRGQLEPRTHRQRFCGCVRRPAQHDVRFLESPGRSSASRPRQRPADERLAGEAQRGPRSRAGGPAPIHWRPWYRPQRG